MKLRKLAVHALAAAMVAGGVTAATATPAMAASLSFPLYDANGVQRSSMTYETTTQYLMACYPSDFTLVIEEQLDNGSTIPRWVEQFQCNVAFPFNGGKVVAVRGIINGHANEWQPVS